MALNFDIWQYRPRFLENQLSQQSEVKKILIYIFNCIDLYCLKTLVENLLVEIEPVFTLQFMSHYRDETVLKSFTSFSAVGLIFQLISSADVKNCCLRLSWKNTNLTLPRTMRLKNDMYRHLQRKLKLYENTNFWSATSRK